MSILPMTGVRQMVTETAGPVGSRGGPKRPGQETSGHASAWRRDLRILSPQECLSLLEPGGIGRVGFMSAKRVEILPVNFAVTGKAIIVRTGPDTLLAVHACEPVSFEADCLDEDQHEGWSVLVQGRAHKVISEGEVQQLERKTRLEPWAGGARDVWVRITPARISGRRVQRAGPLLPGAQP